MRLVVDIRGMPAPQGSKRHVGGGRMVESSKAVGPWREAVRAEAAAAMTAQGVGCMDGPLRLDATFWFLRPRSHYRTGRNAHLLRNSAPPMPATIPDLSKLIRSTEDALTDAGVWADDARVVLITARKVYSNAPGAVVVVRTWDEA